MGARTHYPTQVHPYVIEEKASTGRMSMASYGMDEWFPVLGVRVTHTTKYSSLSIRWMDKEGHIYRLPLKDPMIKDIAGIDQYLIDDRWILIVDPPIYLCTGCESCSR